MTIDEMVEEITEHIYKAYGSDTGVLFGIPASYKRVVKVIVKLVIEYVERKKLKKGSNEP